MRAAAAQSLFPQPYAEHNVCGRTNIRDVSRVSPQKTGNEVPITIQDPSDSNQFLLITRASIQEPAASPTRIHFSPSQDAYVWGSMQGFVAVPGQMLEKRAKKKSLRQPRARRYSGPTKNYREL